MDDLELKSKILLGVYSSSVIGWFLVPENQAIIIFIVTIIVSCFAIASYWARIKRDNTSRKIEEYKLLDEEIKRKKDEEKPD